jgi:ankyrin repeat protein
LTFTAPVFSAEIHLAAKNNDFEAIKKLLKKDPKLLDSGNQLNQTALLIAAYKGNMEIVQYLVNKKADINKKDNFGGTPLHMATLSGKKEIVEFLISKGADITARSQNGKIPMQLAFESEHLEIIELFFKRGVDVKKPIDQFNRTLLHKAAVMGKAKVAGYLLDKGINIDHKDKTDRSALDLAIASGNKNVVDVLRKRGAKGESMEPLEIAYVANDGFVLTSGIKKVMIDSMFHFAYGQFEVPTKEIIQKFERAEEPFNGVKYLLVTHNFPDHFDVGMVETYMKKHSNVILISPRQVNMEMEIYGFQFPSLKHRMVSVAPAPGSGAALTVKDLRMNVFRLAHGSQQTQNLGYIINVGGKSVFHPGNAVLKANKQVFKNFQLNRFNIDVAFIQYFDFQDAEGRAVIKEHIKPKHIILMHLPLGAYDEAKQEAEKYKADFPSVLVFKKPLEKKVFK